MTVKYMPPGKDFDYPTSFGFKSGGKAVRRAGGGMIPGPAPTPEMNPMTRAPTPAPMVSDPGKERAARAARVLGAKQAPPRFQPSAMPGGPAISPAGAAPPPATGLQGMAGTQGLKRGGKPSTKNKG